MDSAAGFLYWRTSCRYEFRFDYKRCLKVSIIFFNYKMDTSIIIFILMKKMVNEMGML